MRRQRRQYGFQSPGGEGGSERGGGGQSSLKPCTHIYLYICSTIYVFVWGGEGEEMFVWGSGNTKDSSPPFRLGTTQGAVTLCVCPQQWTDAAALWTAPPTCLWSLPCG